MTNFKIIMAVSLTVGLAVAGCTSLQELEEARNDSGPTEIFTASYDETFETALGVLEYFGFEISQASKEERSIFAKQGMSYVEMGFFTYGEWVALYFDPISESATRLKIIEKRRVKMNVINKEWAMDIFLQIKSQLTLKDQINGGT